MSGKRTNSGHNDASGHEVHAALEHLRLLVSQLSQPPSQPAFASLPLPAFKYKNKP